MGTPVVETRLTILSVNVLEHCLAILNVFTKCTTYDMFMDQNLKYKLCV